VAASPHTVVQVLSMLAGVMAVTSLVLTLLYIRDRQQRRSGLLLTIGIICQLGAQLFDNAALQMVIIGVATVLVIVAAILNVRILRARPD
jgi:hypothetical protein